MLTKVYRSRRHLAVTAAIIALPFFTLIVFSRVANVAGGRLALDVFISLWRLAIAYIIAVVVSWLLAISFYQGKRADIALPMFDVLQSFPSFAALPLAITFFGPSNALVILFLTLAILWPIFFSVIGSLKLIKREWREAAQMSGLRGSSYFRYFLWPASIPGVITGSIIGLGEGWEALVVTEIIVNVRRGVGGFFQSFAYSPTITMFGILGFLVIIFSINKLLWLPLLEWGHHQTED